MTGNIGQTGIESIRIGGKPIAELNVRQRMEARVQLELTEAQKARRAIKDKYPPYNVASMEAAVKEAHANIQRFTECIQKEQATISEFTGYIALCCLRDQELAALPDE